jgi:hypothetical protein
VSRDTASLSSGSEHIEGALRASRNDRSAWLHILQHAIGRDQYGHPRSASNPEFRNHFCTGPGSKDYDACMALVGDGLMTRRAGSAISGGDDIFYVTDAGRAYVREHSPKPPKLTRSQRRYQAFLDADFGDTFGEWLRSGGGTR